jgi:threonine dehydrogenase-like Zn-dependent dehydrogenase
VAANVGCGECAWCRRGLENHCERFTTHGIFVASVAVPAASCFPIGFDVPSHIAALAEPLSTVVNGVRLADVFPGETAVVIGAGPIGLMFTALLDLAGAKVIAIEPAQRRRELAEAMGAFRVVDPAGEDLGTVVRAVTDGLGGDVVVDAVGSQLPTALELVRKAGRIVLFGMNAEARAEISQNGVTRNELSVLGAYVGRKEDVFPVAVRLLEQRWIDFEPLVTQRIALAELPRAVEELRAGRAVKVAVEL